MKNGLGLMLLWTRISRVWWLPALFLLAITVAVKAEDYTYTTNNGTITITKYTGSDAAVTIPSIIEGKSVTSIGNEAFRFCNILTNVTIPNGVTNIGNSAFAQCTSLTSVAIPDSVTTIGSYAFFYCTSLTSVTIPDSVTSIGEWAFDTCTSLPAITVDADNSFFSSLDGVLFNKSQTTLIKCPGGKAGSYTIPNGVTNIGKSAFAQCTSLTGVAIPDSVTTIGDNAFVNCSLTSVTIGNGVTSIGDQAFIGCSLTSVTIGNSVTTIGGHAFRECTSLTNVMIGNGVTSIGSYAFYCCPSLTSVTIGDNVTSIGGNYAFGYCSSLTSITIPDSVTNIGNYAFSNCRNLTNVTIGSSVTTIGDSAFYYCDSLTSVTIGNNVASIGDGAFSYCTSLPSVTIPNSVTTIGGGAFVHCDSLTSVTIPDSVTSIGGGVFESCDSLTSVTIGNGVTSIGLRPFLFCTNLTAITVDAGNSSYSSLDGVLFNKSQTKLIQCPGGKTGSYTIPASVTNILGHAFRSCASLSSVTIPTGVTSIGEETFCECTSLTSVTIPAGVTSIGGYAFFDCTSLTSVTIPASVTSIDYGAFYGCTNLTSVYFKGNAPSIGSYVFDGDDSATVYYLAGPTGWGSTFGGRPTALWTAPPEIMIQPQSRTNNPGSTVSFTVTACGTAPLNYQWQQNSANIGSANSATYTIGSVVAGDAGDYRCIVSNMIGVVTSAVATLMVNDPPYLGATSVSNIMAHTAYLGGIVTATNGSSVTERGCYWGTNSGSVRADGIKYSEKSTFGTGAFSFFVTNLPSGQTNYFLAYAVNGAGTNFTGESPFLTRPDAPVILPPTNIITNTLDANWQSVESSTNYWLDVASTNDFSSYLPGYSNREAGLALTCSVTGLQTRVVYYYRVRSENATGVSTDSTVMTVSKGTIGLLPASLSYTGVYAGANPVAQNFVITNSGYWDFNFTNSAAYSADASGWWLATPAAGNLAGVSFLTIAGNVTAVGLNAGTYHVTNAVISSEATNSPQYLVATLTVSKGNQAITNFIPAGGSSFVTTNAVRLFAQASSRLAVTNFTVISGPGVISGFTNLTFTNSGAVSVRASQAGDTNWNTAPTVTNTYAVTKATALVTLTNLNQTYDGTPRVTSATTIPGGLSVTITYNGSGSAPTAVGNYAVMGVVNSALYQGSANGTLTVSKGNQTITFPAIPDQMATSRVTLAATVDSGLAVSFSVGSGPGTISGDMLTFTGAGIVQVVASQGGNAFWNAAANVTNNITVNMVPLPSAPMGVSASDGTFTDKVRVTWNAVGGATGYEVWRNMDNDSGAANQIGTPGDATYDDTSATAGTTYYYWVKAKNTTQTSEFSSPDTGYRASSIHPDMGVLGTNGAPIASGEAPSVLMGTDFGSCPTGLSVERVFWVTNSAGAALTISDVTTNGTGATSFRIENLPATVEGGTASNFHLIFSPTMPGLHMAVVAIANNSTGTSFVVNVSGVGQHLEAPTGVSATDGSYTDKVRVTWTAISEAIGYEVWRNMSSDNVTAAKVFDVTTTSADDTTADFNTVYYYWVKAKNTTQTSGFSSPDSGYRVAPVVPLNAPANVSASDGTYSDKVRVTWNAVGGAAGYEVWRYTSDSSGSASKISSPDPTGTSYDDTSAVAGTTYYYWVKAKNTTQTSGFSTSDSGYLPATVTPDILPAPTGMSASDGTFTDKVRVSWTGVSGTSFYEVWRSASNNTANASNLGTTATTTYDDLTAATTPGTIQYYWVKARTLVSASEFSYPDSGFCRSPISSGSADLSISSVLFDPVVIQQGQHPGLLMLMLANNGPDAMNDSPVNFAFYLSGNDQFGDGDDQWIGDYSKNATITVGGYTTVILSSVGLEGVTIPPVPDGNYYVYAKAQHASTLTDPDDNNNTCKRAGTIQIGAAAGLKIPVSGDFDGDKKTDLALYQEATGTWQIKLSGSGYGLLEVPGLGGSGFAALAGDFDGDGLDDPAIYDEATGDWKIWKSRSGYVPVTVNHGGLGFKPVPGDYNGMLMEDIAVYQEARGYWIIILSETTALSYYNFGADGYIPVTGDYDGDGKTDMALYEQSTGNWRVKLSSAGGVEVSLAAFGGPGYVPVIADYDGDGLADLGLYNETMGTWMIRLSTAGYAMARLEGFGGSGYVPVTGDFDGDGLADLVIYETATSTWIFRLSSMGYAPVMVVF